MNPEALTERIMLAVYDHIKQNLDPQEGYNLAYQAVLAILHAEAGRAPSPAGAETPKEDWSHRLIELSDRYRHGYGDISEMVRLFEQCALHRFHAAPSPAAEIGAKEAFFAAYHAQWIRDERRWIFDPLMKPGDPEHCWQAWLKSRPSAPQGAREQEKGEV